MPRVSAPRATTAVGRGRVGDMGIGVRRVGTITIGQLPRSDMIPEIRAYSRFWKETITGQ